MADHKNRGGKKQNHSGNHQQQQDAKRQRSGKGEAGGPKPSNGNACPEHHKQ